MRQRTRARTHARTRAHAQVQSAWLTTDFVVLPYKDTRDLFILGAVDDVLQARPRHAPMPPCPMSRLHTAAAANASVSPAWPGALCPHSSHACSTPMCTARIRAIREG